MIKKDIFEVLRDKMHCEYVSDLLFVDYERIRIHLEYMDPNDFELKEILDAIPWTFKKWPIILINCITLRF